MNHWEKGPVRQVRNRFVFSIVNTESGTSIDVRVPGKGLGHDPSEKAHPEEVESFAEAVADAARDTLGERGGPALGGSGPSPVGPVGG